MNTGNRTSAAIVFLLLAISSISPVVFSQDEQTGNQTFQFHTIASLGDSTLGSDPTGYRGPFASIHAANLMEVDYYEGAVGGDRSWTLINAGRHTSIAENYSAGTLVTMMVGAWDFIDSDIKIVDGDYSFIEDLEENITIIIDTLIASDIDVLVWNLPNMSFLPFLTQIFPTEVHPHFTEASLLWANRLDEIADSYGESVQVFDLMTASDDLLQNKSARELGSHEVISPPEMCEKNCIMVDSLHPTSVGQGLLANYMMRAINEKFPSPNGDYPLLSEEELIALADFSLSEQPNEEIMIEGDVTKACFDWSESSYRQMYLSISNNGEDIPVPSYIGFNTELCRQSTHVMYSGESSVNIISNIENNLTLNHFFEIWGKNFSSQQIMDLAVSDGGYLALYLDGVEYDGDWSSIPIQGVISVEIKLTNPIEDLEGDEETSRTPGFSVILSVLSLLLASSRTSRWLSNED